MPGFDQTGPESQGPMTGRGMGRCSRRTAADDQQEFTGGRMRPGRGCRRGRRGQGGQGGRFRPDRG